MLNQSICLTVLSRNFLFFSTLYVAVVQKMADWYFNDTLQDLSGDAPFGVNICSLCFLYLFV